MEEVTESLQEKQSLRGTSKDSRIILNWIWQIKNMMWRIKIN